MNSASDKNRAGIILTNVGLMVLCFTRAVAYSELFGEPRESPGPHTLSDSGTTLWWYALLWGLAGVLCLWEAVRVRLWAGVWMTIPLLGVWSVSYGVAWAESGFHSWDWMTFTLYLSFAMVVVGYAMATMELQRRTKVFRDKVLSQTGSVPVQGGKDSDRP